MRRDDDALRRAMVRELFALECERHVLSTQINRLHLRQAARAS